MTERRGFHLILKIPAIYRLVQAIFSHKPTRTVWDKWLQENPNGKVLDVGCGPGLNSRIFSSCSTYVGIDISERYISEAQRSFGDWGEFFTLSALEIDQLPHGNFDLVILSGVLHHLTDGEVSVFFKKIKQKLSKTASIVILEPTFKKGRHVANLIVSMDRGLHVRWPTELKELIDSDLAIKDEIFVEQHFPPYQRILLKLGLLH